MRIPSNISAQQICSILKAIQDKLQIAALLSVEILSVCKESKYDEIRTQVQNLLSLEEQMLSSLKSFSNEETENQGENEEVTDELEIFGLLKPMLLDILRSLFKQPDLIHEIKAAQTSHPTNFISVIKYISELSDITCSNLCKTVDEENSQRDLVVYYMKLEKNTADQLEEVQSQVAATKEASFQKVKELNLKVEELENKVSSFKEDQKELRRMMLNEVQTRIEERTQKSAIKIVTLTSEYEQLENELESWKQKYSESEEQMKVQAHRKTIENKELSKVKEEKLETLLQTAVSELEQVQKYQRDLMEVRTEAVLSSEGETRLNSLQQSVNEAASIRENNLREKFNAAHIIQRYWKMIKDTEVYRKQIQNKKKGKTGANGKPAAVGKSDKTKQKTTTGKPKK